MEKFIENRVRLQGINALPGRSNAFNGITDVSYFVASHFL